MSAAVALIAAIALALGAAGLILWQHARTHAWQQSSAAFIEAQIREVLPVAPALPGAPALSEAQDGKGEALRHFFLRAGIDYSRRLWLKLVAPGIALSLVALLFGGALSAAATLLLYVVLLYFRFWLKAATRQRRMLRQLPVFLDTMVRLMSIGNSLGAAFQTAVPTTEDPLRRVMERASGLLQAGVDLELALRQQAQVYRFAELELIAAVVGVASRVGGRADMVLERMSAFMRDLEQAQHELVALSAETRLSAWVMGLLPIALGLFIIIFNNRMFIAMWQDPVGRNMLLGAAVLELVGTLWMIKLAKSV